jgi:selenocysteine lyase/cysteine desulfurase
MTELTFEVARTLAQGWGLGDEVIVTRLDHDGNIRPWVTYAERAGATVRWAEFDPGTGALSVDDVARLLSDRTRLVAVTGASNLLGTRPDVAAIGEAVGRTDALYYVDGVHLTAHAPIDMASIGADFFVCSPYKFLGPHIGMLAASPALLETLHSTSLRLSTEEVPDRFELGTLPYELLAGVTAAIDVLADLVPGDEDAMSRRDRIVRSMSVLEEYEDELRDRMRAGLTRSTACTAVDMLRSARRRSLFLVDGVSPHDVHRRLAQVGQRARGILLRDRAGGVDGTGSSRGGAGGAGAVHQRGGRRSAARGRRGHRRYVDPPGQGRRVPSHCSIRPPTTSAS